MSARYARRSRFVAIAVGDLGALVLSVLDSEGTARSANKVRPRLQFLRSPPMSPICSVALLRSTTNPGGFSLPSKRATLGHAAPQQRRPANPRRDAPVRPLAVGALPQRQVYAPGPDGDNTLDHPLGWQCLE